MKIDNLKSWILEANLYEAIYQKDYYNFSQYYWFQIFDCKPRRPEEKWKVESWVKYVKNSFFKWREFSCNQEIENKLYIWQEEKCNKRIHWTTRKVPEIVFNEQEKDMLINIPKIPWKLYTISKRKVDKVCHILVEWNYYSTPYKYSWKEVFVKVYKKIIRIYFNNTLIAIHRRKYKKWNHYTNLKHYPWNNYLSEEEKLDIYKAKTKKIWENLYSYFKKLKINCPYDWERKTKWILKLSKRYNNNIIDSACKRAMSFELYSYRVILNICNKWLYKDMSYIDNILINEKINSNTNCKIKNDSDRPLSYYWGLLNLSFFLLNISMLFMQIM